jgi:SAM-dependent methyltransferase
MPENNEGYVLDTPYTWSFFDFQSPVLMAYIARLNGIKSPPTAEPFTYCELGCGNGVTSNLLAAALPQGDFYAVDINPEHIENGNRMAAAGGLSNITFIESGFADLDPAILPKFDYITLHGVYSWVSEPIRRQALQVMDAFLKPGGLVYVSYNALPGWAGLMPIWKLMHSYTANMETDSLSKAKAGLKHLELLRNNGARYFRENRSASEYLDKMLKRNISYVAHEFCNDHFHPLYFSEVAEEMAEVDLQYVGSAKVINNYPKKIVSSRLIGLLDEISDKTKHQERLSNIRAESFRRDIYVKGNDSVSGDPNDQLLMDCIPGSLVEEADIRRSSKAGRKGLKYKGPPYDDLIRLGAAGHLSVAELLELPAFKDQSKAELLTALNNLLAGSDFQMFARPAVKDAAVVGDAFRIVADINRVMLNELLLLEGKCYVSSGVLGSAIRLSLMRGLCLQALDAVGLRESATYIEATLEKSGQWWPEKLAQASLQAERKAWIQKEVAYFEKHWIPRLLRLGIIEAL